MWMYCIFNAFLIMLIGLDCSFDSTSSLSRPLSVVRGEGMWHIFYQSSSNQGAVGSYWWYGWRSRNCNDHLEWSSKRLESFNRVICSRRRLTKFQQLWEECVQEEERITVVTTLVVLSGFLSSEPSEPDKDDLFGLQKTFRIASWKCLLYYITCSYPVGEL